MQGFLSKEQFSKINTPALSLSRITYWKGQLAHLKNSLKHKGGHLTLPQKNLAYIRIPKAASTSASAMMLYEQQPELRSIALTDQQLNFLADISFEHTIHPSVHYFTFIRNPFERLAAVYHEFFKSNASDFIYGDYLFGILSNDLSFNEFVNRVASIPDILKDQHLKPQQLLLLPYLKKKCNLEVLKLDEVEAVTSFLMKNHLELPHLHKPASSYDYRDYYTMESFLKASKIYAADITFFGYTEVQKKLEKYLSNPAKSVH